MVHARPFWTSTLQDLSNSIKKTSRTRCFDPCNRTLSFRESRSTLKSHFRECEWRPHTSFKVGLRQERASGKPSARKELNDVNNGMCSSSPASKMNSAFIPSKPAALFLCSFFSTQSSSASVIFLFRVWLGGGSFTWAEWLVRNHMGGEDWPIRPRKPSKSVVTLILSTTGALGRYFFQNKSASTLTNIHICWALVVSQTTLFFFNKFLSLLSCYLATCESRLTFSQSLNSCFAIRQSASNQGLWQCPFLQLLPKGLLPKVDSVVTPTHCCNRLANPFAPRCPIKLATHRFLRLVVRASWYSSTFDLSYSNLGKNFFVTTVCCGSTKVQSMFNCRCNDLWSKFPPIMQ